MYKNTAFIITKENLSERMNKECRRILNAEIQIS
jgi:hypothetical protein